jgi:putative Mg2+ transporter-C (MgtC) family protein
MPETLTDAVSDDLLGLVLKLLAAIAAGLVLGFDREVKGHAAGLRTHALVALASAATAALALELHSELLIAHPNSNADPLRIVEGLVAAVGFLGGGVIIRSGGQIRGLTTAANLWACGIIGLAFGAGLWRIGFLTLLLAFVVLVLLHAFERRVFQKDEEAPP